MELLFAFLMVCSREPTWVTEACVGNGCGYYPPFGFEEVIRLSYIDKVLSRLNLPGLILLIAGAVAVFISERIAEKCNAEKKENINFIIKTAGGFVAFAGVLILLDVIG